MYQLIISKFLKQHHVCKEGIKFFENNFLETLFPDGLYLSKIEVTGDYKGYFYWISKLLEYKFEYDDNGNIIKKIYPDGYIEKHTFIYDSLGRLI